MGSMWSLKESRFVKNFQASYLAFFCSNDNERGRKAARVIVDVV